MTEPQVDCRLTQVFPAEPLTKEQMELEEPETWIEPEICRSKKNGRLCKYDMRCNNWNSESSSWNTCSFMHSNEPGHYEASVGNTQGSLEKYTRWVREKRIAAAGIELGQPMAVKPKKTTSPPKKQNRFADLDDSD